MKGGTLFDGWWNNAARQYNPMSVEEVEKMEKQIRKQQEQDYEKAKGK